MSVRATESFQRLLAQHQIVSGNDDSLSSSGAVMSRSGSGPLKSTKIDWANPSLSHTHNHNYPSPSVTTGLIAGASSHDEVS
jgi:hypothetical protein